MGLKGALRLLKMTRADLHLDSSSFIGPSLRVQEAERKLQLVNDPQAGEFDARSVMCRICQQTIRLSEKIPFDLEIWVTHKASCLR